jgi:uncharacterized SAM-binding protein YcdF (DUF218 family)
MKSFFIWSSVVIILVMLGYQQRHNLAIYYAKLFVVNNATKGADAILILNGSLETRAIEAIRLFKEGYSKQIWAIKPYSQKTKYPNILKSPIKILVELLTYEGVDKLFILPELKKEGVTSTFDEAYVLASYLKYNKDVKRIIIVTDGFHTKRAEMAFNKILLLHNITTKIQFSPAFSEHFIPEDWYKYEKSLFTLLISEPIKLLVYYFSSSNSTLYKNT